MRLRFRPAGKDDLLMVFNWANEPETRSMSFNEELLSLPKHSEWFQRVLNSDEIDLLIVEGQKSTSWQPVGLVRFDRKMEISLGIAKEFRGKGLGTTAIKMAAGYAKRKLSTDNLIAYIRPGNTASVKAFEKAGFKFNCEKTVRGKLYFKYVLNICFSK